MGRCINLNKPYSYLFEIFIIFAKTIINKEYYGL